LEGEPAGVWMVTGKKKFVLFYLKTNTRDFIQDLIQDASKFKLGQHLDNKLEFFSRFNYFQDIAQDHLKVDIIFHNNVPS